MHSQTYGFWAWKQDSTKKQPMISFFRILPGMFAVGMLTGKAVGHHMSTLIPAVTPHLTSPHLTSLACLLFGSCFCFTPSCGGTEHKLFQCFINIIELLVIIWTFVFCLLKKTCWALLGLLCESLGRASSLETQRAKVWSLASDTISSLLLWNGSVITLLIIVAFSYCWKKVPTVSEKVPVLSSCSQKWPRCH